MSARVDEIEAAVDTVVFDVSPVQPRLVTEILVILVVDVVNYGLPAECVWCMVCAYIRTAAQMFNHHL